MYCHFSSRYILSPVQYNIIMIHGSLVCIYGNYIIHGPDNDDDNHNKTVKKKEKRENLIEKQLGSCPAAYTRTHSIAILSPSTRFCFLQFGKVSTGSVGTPFFSFYLYSYHKIKHYRIIPLQMTENSYLLCLFIFTCKCTVSVCIRSLILFIAVRLFPSPVSHATSTSTDIYRKLIITAMSNYLHTYTTAASEESIKRLIG